MFRARSAVVATVAAAAATLAMPVSAVGSPAPQDPVGTGFAGPLQIAVSGNGVYVAQDFAGLLTRIRPDGSTKDLVTEPGSEIAGVAVDGFDVVYTQNTEEPSGDVESLLKRRFDNGTVRTVANLGRFEATNNPDGAQTYGFPHLKPSCANQISSDFGPPSYSGVVESHPYAVANAPGGGWYVADAAANDILFVSLAGDIAVVKVIRPVRTVATAEYADANGLPECVVGKAYNVEPVPTDVEVNRNGYLIVSLLPGGAEDGSLGANGRILRIDPIDGEFSTLATGLAGATNVAVAPGGRVYVAELFGQRISVVQQHQVSTVAEVTDPAALEFRNGLLYASVDVFANGSVVTIAP
ncbi:MAG TPA: ScyD/ScyE family protein [Nocardioidaceae bacterium]|nr:ScyD/ScyE family protein [Nocardioidaceae bacterium]